MAESRTRELVHRLEPSASAAPRMNQARVAALAALGFGYIILMLLAVLAALVGVVYLAATSHAAMLIKLATRVREDASEPSILSYTALGSELTRLCGSANHRRRRTSLDRLHFEHQPPPTEGSADTGTKPLQLGKTCSKRLEHKFDVLPTADRRRVDRGERRHHRLVSKRAITLKLRFVVPLVGGGLLREHVVLQLVLPHVHRVAPRHGRLDPHDAGGRVGDLLIRPAKHPQVRLRVTDGPTGVVHRRQPTVLRSTKAPKAISAPKSMRQRRIALPMSPKQGPTSAPSSTTMM